MKRLASFIDITGSPSPCMIRRAGSRSILDASADLEASHKNTNCIPREVDSQSAPCTPTEPECSSAPSTPTLPDDPPASQTSGSRMNPTCKLGGTLTGLRGVSNLGVTSQGLLPNLGVDQSSKRSNFQAADKPLPILDLAQLTRGQVRQKAMKKKKTSSVTSSSLSGSSSPCSSSSGQPAR